MNLKKFVISTKRFTDRHKTFEEMNSHILNYNWRLGLDAQDYPYAQSIFDKFSDILSPNLSWNQSIILNAISHYDLIKECATGNEIFTIMEDDAVLTYDFDIKASHLMNSLTDSNFDLIQWGWNWDIFVFVKNSLGEVERIDWGAKYLRVSPAEFKETEAKSTLLPLIQTFGSHCYSLSPHGAKQLLEFIPLIEETIVNNINLAGISYRAKTFDGVLNAYYSKLRAYICIAPLSYVTNDKTKSVIRGT